MNQKNSFGLDKCFGELDDPFKLFGEWFNKAKETEINDPNALALATADKNGAPSVRMVLLKDFSEKGFVFYTNLESKKSGDIKNNPNASMCFHWKSLLRQIRIVGTISSVSNQEADNYYNSRAYGSRIGAWASKQSKPIVGRPELETKMTEMRSNFSEQSVPKPKEWGGYRLIPSFFEFWQGREDRLHDRICYLMDSDQWKIQRLSP